MRLTNSTLLRGYNRDLQRLKTQKNACEKKITSTRKFSRASEAPMSAAKALNVRKSQYYAEQYKENLKVANKFYTEAETSLLHVSEKMAEIRETIIAAVNTTKDNVDYNIYAQQLETMAHELCTIFNTDSAGRAIFGGESDSSTPFTIINDANGAPATVLYHGVPVNALDDYLGFPFSKFVYMDIGLGMVTDQQSHQQDPMTVLDISFNGAKVTGCGAEYGVADIDLTSILENRSYVIDVYADGVKHTIAFRGQSTPEGNVAEIRKQLEEAFSKEKDYGKNIPAIDDQGMIYLTDSKGNALDKGIVSVVNSTLSTANATRVEQLTVENDSNYTNKYKLNLKDLAEDQLYTMDVEVDGVRKTITFKSGSDDPANNKYREDFAIENLQAALDKAFGPGKVNVTDHAPNKGVISTEGGTVKLYPGKLSEGIKPRVSTTTFATIDYDSLVPGKKYSVKAVINGVEYNTTFEAGATASDSHQALDSALEAVGSSTSHSCNPSAGMGTCGGYVINFLPADGENPLPLKTEYITSAIDIKGFQNGKSYDFDITINGVTKTVSVTGGADEEETFSNLSGALREAFPNDRVYVGNNGEIVTMNAITVEVAEPEALTPINAPYERERIYSNNYIQLTLDAARALRNGDIEYANGCIDRIVSASENLLATIADIGCNEDFVDFNIERLTTRGENLDERQNDLEITDPEYQITLWKTFEAYYNACLQMSAAVVPNSIFNYMK